MDMSSSVMRFALATYLMKSGYDFHHTQTAEFSGASPTYEPILVQCEDIFENKASEEFSNVVSTHVSNLRQLLVEQRFQDWSKGVAELREYVIINGLVRSLGTLLVKLLKRQEQNAVCLVQSKEFRIQYIGCGELDLRYTVIYLVTGVIEHMCFEDTGEPSKVFDQFVELLFEALSHCWENKDAGEASWILRVIHSVVHGLHQYHEQQYGLATQNQFNLQNETMITEMIHDCLVESRSATKD